MFSNWKSLYHLATEEPVSELFVMFRIKLGLMLLPKHIRSLAIPLLSTAMNLISEELKLGRKNIVVKVLVEGEEIN